MGETDKRKIAAVVLAAGKGTRMKSSIQKQYMELAGKPLLCHSLDAFERSPVDEVIVVTGIGEEKFCRETIINPWGFSKVTKIVPGGKERYHSVYEGLRAAAGCDYVLIHDGARPCLSQAVILAAIEGAVQYTACVIGVPVKDTIKVADDHGFAETTPDRSRLWQIQTPQAFSYELVFQAYEKLFQSLENQKGITDDAMVVEQMTSCKVKLIQGEYSNIKVTTPEDIAVAEAFLNLRKSKG